MSEKRKIVDFRERAVELDRSYRENEPDIELPTHAMLEERRAFRAIHMLFAVAAAAISTGVAVCALYLGHPATAATVIVSANIALVSAFILRIRWSAVHRNSCAPPHE